MRNHKVLFVAALIIVAALMLSGCNLGGNQISGAMTPTVPAATEEPAVQPSTPMPPTDEPVAEETAEAEATEEVVEAEATEEVEAEATEEVVEAEATEEVAEEPTPTAQPTEETLGVEEDGGVWFRASEGGSEYDLFCKEGVCLQPNLPEMGDRTAHQVEFVLDEGTYWFFGVEAALFNADNGRVEVARRENGVLFMVPADGTVYVADVLESEAAGFSIYAEDALTLEGIVFSSPQGHEYDVLVGGETGDWYYQPWLPAERLAHAVEILLPVGSYLFNGVECSFEEDGVFVGLGNQIPFSVIDTPSTVLVTCNAGDGSGFSIETIVAED